MQQLLQLLQVYEVVQSRDGLEALSFTVPRSEAGGAVNNRRETFSFKSVAVCVRVLPASRVSLSRRFSRVFDSNTGQEEVFDAVSREVIDKLEFFLCNYSLTSVSLCYSCLEGYNGTIFAYGQVSPPLVRIRR